MCAPLTELTRSFCVRGFWAVAGSSGAGFGAGGGMGSAMAGVARIDPASATACVQIVKSRSGGALSSVSRARCASAGGVSGALKRLSARKIEADAALTRSPPDASNAAGAPPPALTALLCAKRGADASFIASSSSVSLNC